MKKTILILGTFLIIFLFTVNILLNLKVIDNSKKIEHYEDVISTFRAEGNYEFEILTVKERNKIEPMIFRYTFLENRDFYYDTTEFYSEYEKVLCMRNPEGKKVIYKLEKEL